MLSYNLVTAFAKEHGFIFEREGKGYSYWSKSSNGSTVGHADSLKEAYEDLCCMIEGESGVLPS